MTLENAMQTETTGINQLAHHNKQHHRKVLLNGSICLFTREDSIHG